MKHILRYGKKYTYQLCYSFVLIVVHSIVSILPATVTQRLLDNGFASGDPAKVAFYAFLLILLGIIQSLVSVAAIRLLAIIGQSLTVDIETDIVNRALSMPTDRISALGVGYISARVTEAESISGIFSPSNYAFLGSIVQAIASFCILISIDFDIAVIALVPSVGFAIATFFVSKYYRTLLGKTLETRALFTGLLNERLNTKDEISFNGVMGLEEHKIKGILTQLRDRNVKQATLLGSTSELFKLLRIVAISTIYVFCSIFLSDHNSTPGKILEISQYSANIYTPIVLCSSFALSIQPALEALHRLDDVFKFDLNTSNISGIKLSTINELKVADLSFSYPGSNRDFFHGISFSLTSPGLAVIKGGNGSGKTTLVKILLGTFPDYRGTISIDGKDLRHIDIESLHNVISVVNQRPLLLNCTVRENILYGNPNADEVEYQSVMKLSGTEKVVNRLPDGDQTMVGEGGTRLSGGERQSIALARALLRKTRVYIFDEPTTHLDDESIAELLKLIKSLKRKSLVLIVDHSGYFDIYSDNIIYIT